jgi:hypothetical protein
MRLVGMPSPPSPAFIFEIWPHRGNPWIWLVLCRQPRCPPDPFNTASTQPNSFAGFAKLKFSFRRF